MVAAAGKKPSPPEKAGGSNRQKTGKPPRSNAIRHAKPSGLRRDQAVDVIRRLILAGNPGFKSGETLSEPFLIKHLGLTKAPIRQALSQLAGEGLVEIKSRVGTQVRVVRPEEAQAMMALRFAIETIVVGELALSRSDLNPLKVIQASMMEISASQNRDPSANLLADFIRCDMDFHSAMAELADGYNAASRTIRDLTSQFILYANRNIRQADATAIMKDVIVDHGLILEALEAHDPSLARDHLHMHLRKSVNRLAAFATPYLNDHIEKYINMGKLASN